MKHTFGQFIMHRSISIVNYIVKTGDRKGPTQKMEKMSTFSNGWFCMYVEGVAIK